MNEEQYGVKLFTNGTIYIDATRTARHMLVTNGIVSKIYWNNEELYNDPLAQFVEERIDLDGCVVYPGFIDSHVHLLEVGYCSGPGTIQLDKCTDKESLIDAVKEYMANAGSALPTNKLIIGVAFSLDDYNSWSLADLDAIDKATADYFFMAIDKLGHNMIVNSNGLKIANIDKDTPSPQGGIILKEKGKPTGMLRESAMADAGNPLFNMVENEIIRRGAKACFDQWSSMGYTAIVDLCGGPFGRMFRPKVCRDMEAAGELSLRINYMYTFFKLSDLSDTLLENLLHDTEMVRFGGLKFFVDSSYAGGLAWTSWENKNKQLNHGLPNVTTEGDNEYNIYRIVERVNDLGLNIHYHVQGDMAMEAVLDAIKQARDKKGTLTSTHTLIHVAFPTVELIEQIKAFKGQVVTTVQPAFWQEEEDCERYYGDRAKTCYPIKMLMDAGISTGISTDFWVSTLKNCHPNAITKLAVTGAGAPLDHPPLSHRDVLRGLTEGSAATTAIRDIGKLDIGCKADMVIYNKDLFQTPPDQVTSHDPMPLSSWIGGKKTGSLNWQTGSHRTTEEIKPSTEKELQEETAQAGQPSELRN